MPSSLPVLRASPSENTLKFAMVSFSGSRILAQHGVDLAQRIAGGLRSRPALLPGSAIKRRHRAGIRDEFAAFQRDDGNARQPLKLQADPGVRIAPASLKPPRSSR